MLDASIPLSVKNLNIQPAIDNYRESAKAAADQQMQAATLRDMQQSRELRAEQLKSAQLQSAEEVRRAHEEQTLRGLAQVNDIRTPEGQGQYLKDAQALGLGHKVPEIAATFAAQAAAQKKAQEDAIKAKRQEGIDRLDLRARLLPTATDQASYQSALQRLKNFGDDLEGLEPNFNPDAVKAHIGEVLSHKDQLEQIHKSAEEANKSQTLAMEGKKLGETSRHNKAMEGIERGKADAKAEAANPDAVKIPGLAPIPGVQITKDSVKKVKDAAQAYDEVKRQVNALRDVYAGTVNPKTGKREGGTGTELAGEKAKELASMVRQLQLTVKGKEFLELGVLAGPDLGLLEEMIPNPTSVKSNIQSLLPLIGDPVNPGLNSFENFIDSKFSAAMERNGFQKAPTAGAPVTIGRFQVEAH